MRRWWIGPVVLVGVIAVLMIIPASRRTLRAEGRKDTVTEIAEALALPRGQAAPPVDGIDLTRVNFQDSGATTPLADSHIARLFVDPQLQRAAKTLMAIHRLPEAAIVMIDVQTGHVLAYASHVEKGAARDLCAEATAPAASLFKIVTGGALVELAGVSPDHKECYSGGEQRILPQDLESNPAKDRWCTTLGGAMGRSINTVFARLAMKNLKGPQLEEFARGFGFGTAIPFDVKIQPSTIKVPEDSLGFARTAAGFWNTTLSPMHAAMLSLTVARGGELVRPQIVSEVLDGEGKVLYTAPQAAVLRRAVKPETATAITAMMDHTVGEGTSYRAFHDIKRTSFLPGIQVAGKTGTLTAAQTARFYTWFTGFAPSHPEPGQRQVAIAVLVVNQPTWHVKANTLSREMLRAYFFQQKAPGVTFPSMRPIAIKDPKPPTAATPQAKVTAASR